MTEKQKIRFRINFMKRFSKIVVKDFIKVDYFNENSTHIRITDSTTNLSYDYFPAIEKYHRHKDNKWFALSHEKFIKTLQNEKNKTKKV